ncbi:hypothetical protein ACIPR8_06970 [Stenotrophomonas sp. LARHCG68]
MRKHAVRMHKGAFEMGKAGFVLALLLLPATAYAMGEIDQTKIDRVKVNVVESVDRFTGNQFIAARRPIGLDKVGFLTTLTLNPAVLKAADAPPSFYAVMSYTGYGWLFFTGRVDVLVDGARFSLQGVASSADREVAACSAGAGCLVEEKVRFVMTKELSDAISQAKSAEVRVVGSRGSVDGQLNEKHVAYFREMAARYAGMGGSYASAAVPLGRADDVAGEAAAGATADQRTPVAEPNQDSPAPAAAEKGAGWRDWGKR